MIQEMITWATTPCAPQARKLGFLYEAIAMQARLSRCHHAWKPHLEQSKAFITQCAQQQPKGGIALILGSGLGVDLPQAFLLDYFDEIWLVDMVHLRQAQQQWHHNPKVKFITHDITESLENVLNGDLIAPLPTHWLGKTHIHFVVSANVLGQLPILPMSWLSDHGKHTEAELEVWATAILQAHLDYLQMFHQQGAGICLVSDMEWRFEEGVQVREVMDAWRGLDQPAPDLQWEWQIAPRGEFRVNRTQKNWVGGWYWGAATPQALSGDVASH